MTGIAEYVWDHVAGRNSEGARYSVHRLIDGTGRVIAKVREPDDEFYDYCAYFHLEKEMDGEDCRFIDADSAKRFVIAKLAERAAKAAAKPEPVAAVPERETADAKP